MSGNTALAAAGPVDIIPAPLHWPVADLAEYHRDKTCESSSTLTLFLEDRMDYFLQRVKGSGPPRGRSQATELGTAFHLYLQEGCVDEKKIVVLPDDVGWKTVKAKKAAEERPGLPVIERDDIDRLAYMHDAVRANPACVELLEGKGLIEHAIHWRHESGVPVKCCFDVLRSDGLVTDIKTAANPTLAQGYRPFRSAVWDCGYYRQAALYCLGRDLYMPYFGEDATDTGYRWIVVGNEPTYQAFVYSLGQPTLKLGTLHNELILSALAGCRRLTADKDDEAPWRSPNHGRVVELDLEPWAFNKELGL